MTTSVPEVYSTEKTDPISDFVMMIGLPYSGKSTIAENTIKHTFFRTNPGILSTDRVIEDLAKRYGYTYQECFKNLYDFAEQVLQSDLKRLLEWKRGVIWDQTNLAAKTRMKRLETVPTYYRKFAIVVENPSERLLEQRRKFRHDKIINDEIYNRMKSSFVYPTFEEGFDEIWDVDCYGTVLEKKINEAT